MPEFSEDCFIQFIADNVDHNTRTLDGHGTFHGMGMIATITPNRKVGRAIPKQAVTSGDIAAAGKLVIRYYNGPIEETSLVYKELTDLKTQDSFSMLIFYLN